MYSTFSILDTILAVTITVAIFAPPKKIVSNEADWLIHKDEAAQTQCVLLFFSLVNFLVHVIWRLMSVKLLCCHAFRECRASLIAVYLMSCSWRSFVLDHSQTQLDQHFCAESLVLLLTDCICGRLARQWLTVYWSWRRRKVTEKDNRDAVDSFQERNSLCCLENRPWSLQKSSAVDLDWNFLIMCVCLCF